MIKPFLVSFFTIGLLLSPVFAELKVAMVDMTHLLNNYHKSKAAEQEEKVNREAIGKGREKREVEIKALLEELKKHQTDLRDPQLSDTKKREILETAQLKNGNLKNLQMELQEFLDRSSRALNEKMVGLMNDIRSDVVNVVNQYAEGAEVDYVFDESGLTSTQVPFIVYVRNRVDITADVLKLLNKDAPKDPKGEGNGDN